MRAVLRRDVGPAVDSAKPVPEHSSPAVHEAVFARVLEIAADISWLRRQILSQHRRGNAPNGQFFDRRIEYAGVGAHLHF